MQAAYRFNTVAQVHETVQNTMMTMHQTGHTVPAHVHQMLAQLHRFPEVAVDVDPVVRTKLRIYCTEYGNDLLTNLHVGLIMAYRHAFGDYDWLQPGGLHLIREDFLWPENPTAGVWFVMWALDTAVLADPTRGHQFHRIWNEVTNGYLAQLGPAALPPMGYAQPAQPAYRPPYVR